MHTSFWPDRARKSLLGPAWPWIARHGDAAFAGRIREAIDPYWAKRLDRVGDGILPAELRARLRDARPEIEATTPGAAGWARVEAAAMGDPLAFWFFDLGCAAWIVLLGRLHRERWLDDEEPLAIPSLQATWLAQGPAQALSTLQEALQERPAHSPALNLHLAPLALWQAHDLAGATLALDRAASRLPPRALAACGATVPLTYALLAALGGGVQLAASFLSEERTPGRPAGFSGYDTPEVRYHRARYLWDLGQTETALALLRIVIEASPAHLLRLLTDPAFRHAEPTAAALHHMAAEVAGQARSRLARWQQSRKRQDPSNPVSKRMDDLLSVGGDGPYVAISAARLLPEIAAWEAEREEVDPIFWTDLERLEEFASELPDSFPLRLGPDFAPRFTGEDSDMERLLGLVDRGLLRQAEQLLGRIYHVAPWATRIGTLAYLARMANALATAGDVLRVRGTESDAPRFEHAVALLKKCIALAAPVQEMADRIGPALQHQASRIWQDIVAIETSWVDAERRQFGLMRIETPPVTRPLRRGGWTSYQIRVTDVAGQPVAGVPVLWRVVSGPAGPREPAECLDGEWRLSLHTGTVHIPVEARGSGDGGEIEVCILGNYSSTRFRYRVTDTPGD